MTTTPHNPDRMTDAQLDTLSGGPHIRYSTGVRHDRRARQDGTQRVPWWRRPTGQDDRPWSVHPIGKPADPK